MRRATEWLFWHCSSGAHRQTRSYRLSLATSRLSTKRSMFPNRRSSAPSSHLSWAACSWRHSCSVVILFWFLRKAVFTAGSITTCLRSPLVPPTIFYRFCWTEGCFCVWISMLFSKHYVLLLSVFWSRSMLICFLVITIVIITRNCCFVDFYLSLN